MKKRNLLITMILILGLVLTACSQKSSSKTASSSSAVTATKTNSNAKKTLIVYYSLTNNTDTLAKKIHKVGDIDIVRIDAKKAYPTDDNDSINSRVKRESQNNQYDQLTNVPKDLNKYDTILVGYPIWSNDIAYPIQSFLSQNADKLANKRIVPFSTSAMADSAAIKQTNNTIKKLVPQATIAKGLNLTSGDASSKRIQNWLDANAFVQRTKSETKKDSSASTAIKVEINGRSFDGYLNDSSASQDLIKSLPQTWTFKTFASGYPEKYAKLDSALNTAGMSGDDPKSGDIDYNSNNQSLFLYYGQVGQFDELHNIGHITSNGYRQFIKSQSGKITVKISAVN